jgi:thymidylate synthase (FAD)
MASMCVEIDTTISIAAQILRHRSFSFQQFSQRYAQVTAPPEIPDLRRQDTKNRQNSIDDLHPAVVKRLNRRIEFLYEAASSLYNDLLEEGVAKECAREVLPLATPTTLYMNGTLRSWVHYCQLRCANGTQKEHQDIANSIKNILAEQVPAIYEAAFT